MSSQELVVQGAELAPTSTLFGTDNPGEVVERAAKIAKTLEEVVRKQNLVVRIGQSEHVRVEGWTFLGSMLGVFPVVEWTRPIMHEEEQVGWEARVEARTRGGEIVGAAEAECLFSERTWKGRDDYALRSMAQTRAVSKALRLPLGFVMQLAGFDPTPADEMPVIDQPPRVDMSDPDIPFGDAAFEQHQPPKITGPQKKKADVLVGTLRDKRGLITTEQLYRSVGRVVLMADGTADFSAYLSEDGELHWGPLRDSLTKGEASALIERLQNFEAATPEAEPSHA